MQSSKLKYFFLLKWPVFFQSCTTQLSYHVLEAPWIGSKSSYPRKKENNLRSKTTQLFLWYSWFLCTSSGSQVRQFSDVKRIGTATLLQLAGFFGQFLGMKVPNEPVCPSLSHRVTGVTVFFFLF